MNVSMVGDIPLNSISDGGHVVERKLTAPVL